MEKGGAGPFEPLKKTGEDLTPFCMCCRLFISQLLSLQAGEL
jgi:hypothetical protein